MLLRFLKFIFSQKTTKIHEITINFTLATKRKIDDGEDLVKFCGLLKKPALYRLVKKKSVCKTDLKNADLAKKALIPFDP